MLYPPELRGHKKVQLVTVIFFSLRVKLCQAGPKCAQIFMVIPTSKSFSGSILRIRESAPSSPTARRYNSMQDIESVNSRR